MRSISVWQIKYTADAAPGSPSFVTADECRVDEGGDVSWWIFPPPGSKAQARAEGARCVWRVAREHIEQVGPAMVVSQASPSTG